MKLIYEYRTNDNVKHEGVVRAADVQDAYAKLKKKGIKPSRVTPASGFFNRFTPRHKLWALVAILALVAAVAVFFAVRALRSAPRVPIFVPTSEFLALQADAERIVEGVTNGVAEVARARRELQTLFRDRYPKLGTVREREEGEKLYGRQVILLDRLESISRRETF